MHKKFDHKAIEEKWQERWKESGLYDVTDERSNEENEYVLVEWPYPSGNLHIGHWFAFAVPDIYVRAHRMQGKNVLFPMGFDAFGLPAENAAIKRGINPREWTESNIAHMKEQLESMGNAFSWNKTTSSTDPDYYKWTQWMFTKFFEKGVAYRGTGTVNWCPGCQTVIANEQIINGDECERSGDKIEHREMPQWMLKITDYADRLVDDLDTLDWPEHIKESQRNWIGRSSGAAIDFEIKDIDKKISVFTTRPDTLYGATYMVLAPEHKLVGELKEKISNRSEVQQYQKDAAKKTEQDRLDATKEKTGVKLEGVVAINPANGEEIPIYIADYVLSGYGTGAIMAVPAHDERDYAFAKQFNLDIKYVVHPNFYGPVISSNAEEVLTSVITNKTEPLTDSDGTLINSDEYDGFDTEEAKVAITEKVGGKMTNTYRLRDWSIGRQRYWGVPIPIVYDPDGKPHAISEEHLPWLLPEDVDPTPTGEPPLAKSAELRKRTEEIFGEGWTPEVETMDTFVDSSWYFLRYIDNHNDSELSSKESQKKWMPVDLYFGGAEHTTMHLLYSRFWQKALFDLGLAQDDEPYAKRINRGLVLGPDGNKMSKSKGNVIDPDEQVGRLGADTVKMYLAFMGPYGEVTNYPWDMGGIAGIRRFLERVYGLAEHVADAEPRSSTALLHKTIDKVSRDIELFKFNTAISALMVYVNHVEKEGLTEGSYKTFLRLVAAFAPHLAEELWEGLGCDASIHTEMWPKADAELLVDKSVTIAVQFDGKVRGTVEVAPDASEDDVRGAVEADEGLKERLESMSVARVVYVPGRIINFIG